MGFSANIRTVSKIEYGSPFFKNFISEYSYILTQLFDEVEPDKQRYIIDTNTNYPIWEINKELLQKAIDYLKNNNFKTTEDISSILKENWWREKDFYNNLKKSLERMLEEGDKSKECIILDWF